MSRIFNIWSSLLDLISPRACTVCGRRLSLSENVLCTACNLHLPRTNCHLRPYDNELAHLFWGTVPIERCAAYFFYLHHSNTARLIYNLKYNHQPEVGRMLGKMIAEEYALQGFFEGIDVLVPMPISKARKRERGYNQCEEIVKGVQEVTGLPIYNKVVVRKEFIKSQTHLDKQERMENVKDAFQLQDSTALQGKHILIVDDIVTTGATIKSLAGELLKAGGIKISIFALGVARE